MGDRYLVLQESHSVLSQQQLVGLLDGQWQVLVEELDGPLEVEPTARSVKPCQWDNRPSPTVPKGITARGRDQPGRGEHPPHLYGLLPTQHSLLL